MPEPGSHKYDIKRARLREQYEHEGINDQRSPETGKHAALTAIIGAEAVFHRTRWKGP